MKDLLICLRSIRGIAPSEVRIRSQPDIEILSFNSLASHEVRKASNEPRVITTKLHGHLEFEWTFHYNLPYLLPTVAQESAIPVSGPDPTWHPTGHGRFPRGRCRPPSTVEIICADGANLSIEELRKKFLHSERRKKEREKG